MSETVEKIVIRHIGEDHEDEAHGGAWKVAYADFMTAMMAFFLLMWILSTTEEQKLEGLADYFTPSFNPSEGIGGEGALAGTAPERRGILASRVKEQPTGKNDAIAAPNGSATNPWADIDVTDPSAADNAAMIPTIRPLYMPGYDSDPSFAERQNGLPGDGDSAHDEDATVSLEAMAEAVHTALENDPTLAEFTDRLQVDLSEAGLEMQILDSEAVPMFPIGQAGFTGAVGELVARLGATIALMPNRIVISGHTDAAPYQGEGYTNWELSTDRAHATRRALIAAGVSPERFARVSGLADQDLLVPSDPLDPSNRRITIHLLTDGTLPE